MSSLLIGCGSSDITGDILFPIVIDENQTQLVGNTCETSIEATNLSTSQEYSLIWMQVSLQDQNEQEFTKVYDSEELATILDQLQVPPTNSIQADLQIDLSSSDLTAPPYEGSVQMIGIGFQTTVVFSGSLNCQ